MNTKPISRYWLLIGITALAIAGLFSLVLVVARTPAISNIPMFSALFHQALVVHVDLSVLLWFLSIACLLWSLGVSHSRSIFPYLEESALLSFALGMLAIALSPLHNTAEPLMSNYIPVLMSPLFFFGLGLVLVGVLLMLVRFFTGNIWAGEQPKSLQYGLFTGAVIAVMAASAFLWSFIQMPHDLAPHEYFELVFWGGGHVLQFLHSQMLLICWILLVWGLWPQKVIPSLFLKFVFSIGALAALATPVAYMFWHVESYEHRNFFTSTMIFVGGVGPSLLALFLLPQIVRGAKLRVGLQRALWSVLITSVLVFLYGGWLGSMIREENVVVPAHYHGSIVGVTLAFMGVAYLLLPKLGYRDVSAWRMAYWQPYVYGGGQVMHISGLAWSGGYGVLRKTPGGMDGLALNVKVAMGFMGLGGVIAIAGGFMFVVVMYRAMRRVSVTP